MRTPGGRRIAIVRPAFVATYPPRRCGIATFTSDLAAVSGGREIAVLHPASDRNEYPREVRHVIRKEERGDYLRTASDLNHSVDVVSVQHEYGIWGGEDGESVLDFVRALRVPAVVTMHTVLRNPTPHQRSVLARLAALAEASVVMSRCAATLLISEYGADASRVRVIPHGVPDVPLVDSGLAKPGLGLAGRDVILSFGLLGPGKGYELAIDALPAVAAAHPSVLYVILGATHPDLIRREGEAYRRSLLNRAQRLGIADHVRFVDEFVKLPELTRWLEAADVFATPYPNLDQIVSGTLSYAMGAGRAIVSTPYAYAAELLADGRGVLVPPGSPQDLAAALGSLVGDQALRAQIGRRAFAFSRRMVWSAVGAEYRSLFSSVAARSRLATARQTVLVGA
jgi:glycosyltransferase involved in cell wall biosynthesis